MRGKILILTGVAVGYVLGAKAGRERYEQIKRTAKRLWNDPHVQHQVDRVEDFAREKAPEVVEFISDGAKKVVATVTGKPLAAEHSTDDATDDAAPAKRAVASTSAKKTAAKSSASKSSAAKSSRAKSSGASAASGSASK